MNSWLKRILDQNQGARSRGEQSYHQKPLPLATCAIMLEIAMADDEFTEAERAGIMDTLRRQYSLSDGEAEDLISEAKGEIDESIDIWSMAHIIDEHLSEEEKVKITEDIWKIIYSDGKLAGHEDTIVHKLYFILGLSHDQMIGAKMRVLDQMR